LRTCDLHIRIVYYGRRRNTYDIIAWRIDNETVLYSLSHCLLSHRLTKHYSKQQTASTHVVDYVKLFQCVREFLAFGTDISDELIINHIKHSIRRCTRDRITAKGRPVATRAK